MRKITPPVNKKDVEECLELLKVHGLVEILQEGTWHKIWVTSRGKKYAVSDETLAKIKAVMCSLQKMDPTTSQKDAKIRALIFVVLNTMGQVMGDNVPLYVGVLNSLTEDCINLQ